MKKSFLPLVILLHIVFTVSAQTKDGSNALGIGDQVPDVIFNKILNYKTASGKLSDFKSKLTILDFWSTTCSSCIAAFPELTMLQREFGDQIKILLVNNRSTKNDTDDRILATVQKTQARTGVSIDLPIPISDSVLFSYFPHQSVPHQVWIDENRTVIAIGKQTYLNRENINTVLTGKQLSIPVKDNYSFDKNFPFLVNGNGSKNPDFIFRSMFTRFKGDYNGPSSVVRGDNRGITGYFIGNNKLISFVQNGFHEEINNIPTNRWIFDVKSLEQYSRVKDTSNMFCYDLVIPRTSPDSFKLSDYLKVDLKRVFNISVWRKTISKKALIITVTNRLKARSTKFTVSEIDLEANSVRKFIHNVHINEIIQMLNNFTVTPLVYESNFDYAVDIDFPANFDMTNEKGLIDVLRKNGFNITDEERVMDVVIITDK